MGVTLSAAVPDLDQLVAAVLGHSTHPTSVLHGTDHWRSVTQAGAELIERGVPADPAVVFCFGLLHDHRRLDDGYDPDHGARAAAMLTTYLGDTLHLDAAQFQQLHVACDRHTHVRRSDDLTVGACFDADRLNLWRVGTRPDPYFLSCVPAREEAFIGSWQQRIHQPPTWAELYCRMCSLKVAQP